MFDRPSAGERAILVQLVEPLLSFDEVLDEFKALAYSAGADVVGIVTGSRTTPEVKYYIGHGKALEVQEVIQQTDANLVLVNHDISPSQARNLEKLLNCRVVDRSGLILDIFASRAKTFEGKLQVELAQLEHLSTRLIRGWTHLERQKGGIGLRGPGETQLETDRRLLRNRIIYIQKRLEKVRKSRLENRRARQKSQMPTVALIGYTNAGKSTLFNMLTQASIYTADKLFATLDPSMRRVNLSGAKSIILADTVGFIRHLPHQLIEAFRATLEETESADLLLHVIDISDPYWRDRVHAVHEVLSELHVADIPTIEVFNKIDKQEGWEAKKELSGKNKKIWISAESNLGIDLLKDLISEELFGKTIEKTVILSASEGKKRAKYFDMGVVIEEKQLEDGGWALTIMMQLNENID